MKPENLILRLLRDALEILPQASPLLARLRKPFLIFMAGLTFTIGSTGLLMGAFTTGLASILMSRGMEMVPAMNIGFFTVGIVSLLGGIAILLGGLKRLVQTVNDSAKTGSSSAS